MQAGGVMQATSLIQELIACGAITIGFCAILALVVMTVD